MAQVINLRLARKAKKRSDKTREAEANRAKFGQTKADKSAQNLDTTRTAKLLDGAKRETD